MNIITHETHLRKWNASSSLPRQTRCAFQRSRWQAPWISWCLTHVQNHFHMVAAFTLAASFDSTSDQRFSVVYNRLEATHASACSDPFAMWAANESRHAGQEVTQRNTRETCWIIKIKAVDKCEHILVYLSVFSIKVQDRWNQHSDEVARSKIKQTGTQVLTPCTHQKHLQCVSTVGASVKLSYRCERVSASFSAARNKHHQTWSQKTWRELSLWTDSAQNCN